MAIVLWRMPWVGSWASQKTVSNSSNETTAGLETTNTTSIRIRGDWYSRSKPCT